MSFGKISIAAAVLATMAFVTGCSSSDDNGNTSGGNTSGGTTSGGTTSGGTATLYDRLGKKEGIATAVHAIVVEELKDAEIAAFFAPQMQTPVPAGRPSATQIEECLVLQLGNAAGGPETYPAAVSGGFQCRDMKTSHAGLGISSATFDKFVTIAAGVLKKAGVADADITTIGSVLNGTKADIVTK